MSKQEALSKEEFSVIYLAHYDAMKRYAARAFYAAGRPDPQRVQDAVQETFRILWEKPASYRNSPSPDGWLYVTLSNTIKNQLRQDNRQAKLLLKVQAAWSEEVHPAPGADLELEGFVPQEDLELLKRRPGSGHHPDGPGQAGEPDQGKIPQKLPGKRKKLRTRKKFGPRPGKNAPCRT